MDETEDAEMSVKGKGVVKPVVIDEGKAGAVGEAQAGDIHSPEYILCLDFDCFRHPQYANAALFKGIHESDGCPVTSAHVQQGKQLGKDVIGGEK
jgi:hypothetical protein